MIFKEKVVFCPIFYLDAETKEITGIGVDLMRIAAENAGYRVTFKAIAEKSLKEALDNPSYDVVTPFGSAIESASGKPSIVSENIMLTPFTLVTVGDRKLPPLVERSITRCQIAAHAPGL